MKAGKIIPAVWVRFTPYLIEWAEKEYGTALTLNGCPVLELRSLPGIRHLLRQAVEEDLEMGLQRRNSMSQLRYDVVASMLDAHFGEGEDDAGIKAFLPVYVPGYLQVVGGAIYPFSRLMQLQERMAGRIAKKVYQTFWEVIYKYAQNFTASVVDRDMLECFCEENNLPIYHLDDLRNQYQRLKRSGYFVKKH